MCLFWRKRCRCWCRCRCRLKNQFRCRCRCRCRSKLKIWCRCRVRCRFSVPSISFLISNMVCTISPGTPGLWDLCHKPTNPPAQLDKCFRVHKMSGSSLVFCTFHCLLYNYKLNRKNSRWTQLGTHRSFLWGNNS